MQNFEFRKSDHHRPSDRDVNDGNKDRKTLRCRTGILALTYTCTLYTVQGGGATLWQKIGPLRREGPRGQYLFCTYFKSVVIHVAFFVVHICTTI